MTKNISEAASLSQLYTNHSVRATAITLWSNAGIPNRHIMVISGHRSEQSLAHYNTRPSTSQLRNCSEVLSQSLVTSTPKSSSAGIAVRQNNSVVVAQEKTASFLESVFTAAPRARQYINRFFGSLTFTKLSCILKLEYFDLVFLHFPLLIQRNEFSIDNLFKEANFSLKI